MMKMLSAMLLSLSMLGGLLCSSMAVGQTKGASVEETIKDTVTVESVDVKNRLLTLKDSTGATQTMEVAEEVKNLPQLKPGDRITVAFKMAVAAEIRKPGGAGKVAESKERIATAPKGAKPGGMTQKTVRDVITVKEVDTAKNALTFVGPQGRTRTIKVRDPKMQDLLKEMKPGDEVEVTYTEALAINVQDAKP